jgi:putative flippase GtrA
MRFMKFSLVGASNTLIDLGVFSLLFYGAGVPVLLAHIAGFCLAVANSFIWNYRWTFGRVAGQAWHNIAIRFITIAGFILCLTTACLWLLKAIMPVMMAKILVIAISVTLGYVLNIRFVFKQSP